MSNWPVALATIQNTTLPALTAEHPIRLFLRLITLVNLKYLFITYSPT
jgi:hypothetical protein